MVDSEDYRNISLIKKGRFLKDNFKNKILGKNTGNETSFFSQICL